MTPEERKKALIAEQKKLAQKISEVNSRLRSEQRKQEERCAVIVGRAVIVKAKEDADLATMLRELISKSVTKNADREAIAEWLRQAPVAPEPERKAS